MFLGLFKKKRATLAAPKVPNRGSKSEREVDGSDNEHEQHGKNVPKTDPR
jgi:hypothetical protein